MRQLNVFHTIVRPSTPNNHSQQNQFAINKVSAQANAKCAPITNHLALFHSTSLPIPTNLFLTADKTSHTQFAHRQRSRRKSSRTTSRKITNPGRKLFNIFSLSFFQFVVAVVRLDHLLLISIDTKKVAKCQSILHRLHCGFNWELIVFLSSFELKPETNSMPKIRGYNIVLR